MMAVAMSLLLNSWKVKMYTSYVGNEAPQPPLKGSLCLTNSSTFALELRVELSLSHPKPLRDPSLSLTSGQANPNNI